MRTGSPVNAQVKGQHEAEYAWFAIADSLPGFSISAGRAADQILSACAHGDAELTIGLPARAAVMLNAIAPSWLARMTVLATRLAARARRPRGRSAETRPGERVRVGAVGGDDAHGPRRDTEQ